MECKLLKLLIGALAVVGGCLGGGEAADPPKFSAIFAFGDSLVDSGNNNHLATLARANFQPYGIDYPLGPTGRFSNGKTFVDCLADSLALPSPTTFVEASTQQDILKGVNFASAAAGILNETGQGLGDRYNTNQQVHNFELTLDTLRKGMEDEKVKQFIGDALAMMMSGSNDYINNYLLPGYNESSRYNPQDYAKFLLENYSRQILTLYSQGLRQFLLVGVGPLGCTPNQRSTVEGGGCIEKVNDMAKMFNTGLISLANQLQANHKDGVFAYANIYDISRDIAKNPPSYGLRVIDTACCGTGRNKGQVSCMSGQVPCSNRGEHFFWDPFHPTEAANKVIALEVYNGPLSSSFHKGQNQTLPISTHY